MLHCRVNGYDMAYRSWARAPPLVCVHGSLCDFRVWSRCWGRCRGGTAWSRSACGISFPSTGTASAPDYTIAQHVADVIGFIEALGDGTVDLMGHSRGGHIAFRVAQQRPDLLRRVVLAEPGGDLDASLAPARRGCRRRCARRRWRRGEDRGRRCRRRLTVFIERSAARRLGACARHRESGTARQCEHAAGSAQRAAPAFTPRRRRGDPRADAVRGRRRHARVVAGGAAGAGDACAGRTGRDDPDAKHFMFEAGPGAVLRGGDGVPGG